MYWNPPNNASKSLEVYISAMKNSILRIFKEKKDVKDNLTQEERSALQNLKDQKDIIIQQADKTGGKIVLIKREDYVRCLVTPSSIKRNHMIEIKNSQRK